MTPVIKEIIKLDYITTKRGIELTTLDILKECEKKLRNIEQKHWAILLAIENIQIAYQELRDVGIR